MEGGSLSRSGIICVSYVCFLQEMQALVLVLFVNGCFLQATNELNLNTAVVEHF